MHWKHTFLTFQKDSPSSSSRTSVGIPPIDTSPTTSPSQPLCMHGHAASVLLPC